ncbi:MAG TPA: hypothetical protein VK162_18865 [Streptosporangiaceae bacterium]|nr:hypothetical protein [Streptosporangiaceae bacterium]
MTVSNNQWLSPAHAGGWYLDVDDRRRPALLVLYHGLTKVLMLAIASAADVPAAADLVVVGSEVPRGVANQLVAQLAAKLAVTDGRPTPAAGR